VAPGAFSYLCLITRGYATDQEIFELAIDGDWRYLGMIGSRTKIRTVFDHLSAKGVPPESLARVRAPIGLRIGARTPGEIGVSIVAERIRARYPPRGLDETGSGLDGARPGRA